MFTRILLSKLKRRQLVAAILSAYGRLRGAQIDWANPQGIYEPQICKPGYYCPDQYRMIICPSGHYCPSGSTVPKECSTMSACSEGSISQTHYGGLVICLILDLFLVALVVVLRRFERKRLVHGVQIIHPAAKSKGDPAAVANGLVDASSADAVSEKAEAVELGTVGPQNEAASESIEAGNVKLLVDAFRKGLGGEDLQINFKFEALGLELKKQKKTVLQGVTGEIRAGRLTAIMGPSGAGKTTFMNVLMGKVNRTKGRLFINNAEAEIHTYKKIIGYVPQEDIVLRELTVRENVLHSARVRLPAAWSNAEVEAYTDAILDALNLTHVAHNLIGDETTRGVSGGQRKRVNIALELAAVPLALFLDEPTSGLDSTAALSVASILKSISRLGLTIVAVIHQPRYEIFTQFDDILMIAPGGLTAYLGPVDGVQGYFENLGYEFDPRANPADILMDILSGHGTNPTRTLTPADLIQNWITHT
ncbi:hypothetical protein HK104_005388, partial [Borealophlyctis nickersoniae]